MQVDAKILDRLTELVCVHAREGSGAWMERDEGSESGRRPDGDAGKGVIRYRVSEREQRRP